ncbi:hypothetical protein LINPERHAP2_LOCUS36980, partial [Linum perenne]
SPDRILKIFGPPKNSFPSFLLRLLLYQNRARRPLRIEACNLGVPRKSSDSCNRANHQSELTVISRRIFGHRRCILFYITDTTPFQFPIAAGERIRIDGGDNCHTPTSFLLFNFGGL